MHTSHILRLLNFSFNMFSLVWIANTSAQTHTHTYVIVINSCIRV